jgi:hypothetical protein
MEDPGWVGTLWVFRRLSNRSWPGWFYSESRRRVFFAGIEHLTPAPGISLGLPFLKDIHAAGNTGYLWFEMTRQVHMHLQAKDKKGLFRKVSTSGELPAMMTLILHFHQGQGLLLISFRGHVYVAFLQ